MSDPVDLTVLSEHLARIRSTLPLQAVEQLNEDWRIDGNDDDPLASMRQGPAEQGHNARAWVVLVNAAPQVLQELRQLREERDANWPPHSQLECTQLHADKVDQFNSTILHWMKRHEAAEAELRAARETLEQVRALRDQWRGQYGTMDVMVQELDKALSENTIPGGS